MEIRELPFSQNDVAWGEGSVSCCPISLMLSLYVNGQCKYSSAAALFHDTATVRKAVQYGSLLWKLGVAVERAENIQDAILRATSTRDKRQIVQIDMKGKEYMMPTIDEIFLRCLRKVASSDGTAKCDTDVDLRDIGVAVPALNLATPVYQSVCELVRNSFILKGIVGVDEFDDIIEFTAHPGFAEAKQKHRLLENMLSRHESSRRSLETMGSELAKCAYGNMPLDLDAMESALLRGGVYKPCADFWYLYCASLTDLIRYDAVLRETADKFAAEVVVPAASMDHPVLALVKSKQASKYRDPSTIDDNDMLDLADALDYIVPFNMLIPSPTKQQVNMKNYATLIRLRHEGVSPHPVIRRGDGNIDPLTVPQVFARPGSYVVTGTAERSISVHVFDTPAGKKEYIVYDSHQTYTDTSTLSMCTTIEALSSAIRQGMRCAGGTVYRLRMLPGCAETLRQRFERIEGYLLAFSGGKYYRAPKFKVEDEHMDLGLTEFIVDDLTDSDGDGGLNDNTFSI